MSSPDKVFRRSGNIPQQFGCGFQIPVRGVDVDVTHVSRQGQQVMADLLAALRTCLQCPDRERVTKLMPTRAMIVGARDFRGFRQFLEG